MPSMFAAGGIGFGGTNSAIFMRFALPLEVVAGQLRARRARIGLSLLSPPPQEINNAATGSQAAPRQARASRPMDPPPDRAGPFLQ